MSGQQRRVEWGRAVRQRSYQLASETHRNSRRTGEQLRRRLMSEAVATEAELERLRRQRAGMEARLDRYQGEQAKLRSKRLLTDMQQTTQPQAAIESSRTDDSPIDISSPDDIGDLTDWEAALLAEFVAKQRALEERQEDATFEPVHIGGLTLEKFLRRCESRRTMDGAIRRLSEFVDSWRPAATVGDPSSRRRLQQQFREQEAAKKPAASTVRVAAEEAPPPPAAADIGRIERDFRSLLQEARKARYLRGRNPEIVERDRELTTEEIFKAF